MLSKDPAFLSSLKNIIKDYNIQEIIQIGFSTTTTVFAKTGLPVITIEYWDQYIPLNKFPNVNVQIGYSLKKAELVNFIIEDEWKPPKKLEYDSLDPQTYYLSRLDGAISNENILLELINNTRKQIIFIDSTSGCAYLEFKKIMELKPTFLQNKILIFSSINHVKHYRSILELEDIGYDVTKAKDKSYAFTSFKLKELEDN